MPKEETKQKYGSLYLGIKTETWLQRLYSPVFMFRRLVYALLTVILADYPTILIHTFLACNLVYWVYLGYAKPNDTKQAQNMEFFNEFGLQLITYNLAVFPHSLNADDELLYGWIMIAVIGTVFAINLVVMVVTTVGNVKRKLSLKAKRKKNIKRMIEIRRIRKLSKFDVEIINEEPVNNASYEQIPVVVKKEDSTDNEIVKIHPNGQREEDKQDSGLFVSEDSGYDYDQRANENDDKYIERIEAKFQLNERFAKQKKAQTQRAAAGAKLDENKEFEKGDGGLALDAYLSLWDPI